MDHHVVSEIDSTEFERGHQIQILIVLLFSIPRVLCSKSYTNTSSVSFFPIVPYGDSWKCAFILGVTINLLKIVEVCYITSPPRCDIEFNNLSQFIIEPVLSWVIYQKQCLKSATIHFFFGNSKSESDDESLFPSTVSRNAYRDAWHSSVLSYIVVEEWLTVRRCSVSNEVFNLFILKRCVLCEADKMAEFGKSLDVMSV